MNSTIWYRVILTNKHNGTILIFATTKTREKAEDVAESLAERYPQEAWDIGVEEERVESI